MSSSRSVRLRPYARPVSTERLETFADGIFAIAATLLVIDVSVAAHGHELGHALVHAWPQYAAYAVSFLLIGVMWVNHHVCFSQIDKVDRTFLFINVGFLMSVAFLPFPTRLVAEHLRDGGERAAALTYGVTMTLIAAGFVAFWFYAAIGRRLIAENADQRTVSGISRSYLPGVPFSTAATLVALWSPSVSLGLFAGMAVFYVLESSLFGQV
jgi:TMEM175 potassium channel family protein